MADALVDLITSKMLALGLRNDEDSTSFVLGIVQEDSFEPDVSRSRRLDNAVMERAAETLNSMLG